MTLSKHHYKALGQWGLRTIAFLTVSTATITVLAVIAIVLSFDEQSLAVVQEKGLSVMQALLTATTLTAFFISGMLWCLIIIWAVIKTKPRSPAIHSYE